MCQNLVNPHKKILFWKLSNIIIIQLKLFNNNIFKNK